MKVKSLFALTVLLAMASCAQDVGTIDRTQHDKIEKKMFAGIWYYNTTVIDVPAHITFTTVGETSAFVTGWEVNKVIFDIQEKMLVVYPVTEYVEGAEKKWHQEKIFKYWDDECLTKGSEKYQCIEGVDNLDNPSKRCCFIRMYVGQPLAAFEITSHFDVTRKYNPQTGEQTNVIEENTFDKKWWQRRYIRVNWAKNLVQNYTFLFGAVTQTPVDYYVQPLDPENPDIPTITNDYIDVVTKVFAEPSPEACNLYGVSSYDCASAIVKFRTAFRKVDPNNDYEPRTFTNMEHMEYFGFFQKERYGYNPIYGVTEEGKVYYPFRWNIWDKTMEELPILDDQGNEVKKRCFKDMADTGCDTTNKNGTKEFCKADDWFQFGHCVIRKPKPYIERGLRPIVWHVSSAFPDDLWPIAKKTADAWSDVFKDTVKWLYFWEEKGLIYGQTPYRSCNTNEDCTPPDALIDTWFDIDNPDPKASSDAKAQKRKPIKTMIITGEDKHGIWLWDWDYPQELATKAGVRYIDLSGIAKEISVGGVSVKAGEKIDNPPNHYMAEIVPVNPGKVTIDIQGVKKDVELKAGGFTLIVFTKDKKIITSWSLKDRLIAGLRVINATDQSLDISIDGGLRVRDLGPYLSTGYEDIGGGSAGTYVPATYVPQRIVALKAGERGDITCARIENQSRCVGYGPRMTADDWKRLDEIKSNLPEMFVICRNQYDPAYDDVYKSKLYAPWVDVISGKTDLPERNPCIDNLPYVPKPEDTEADIRDIKETRAKQMKKNGDIRYSMIHWIPEDLYGSPLGLGPPACDPDTGETFWGVANVYGAPMRTYAAMTRDLFDLINGKISVDEYVTGKKIREYVLGSETSSLSSALMPDAEDIDVDQVSDIKPQPIQIDQEAIKKAVGKMSAYDLLKIVKDKELGKKLLQGLPVIGIGVGKQRLSAIKGTPLENLLINQEIKLMASGGQLGHLDSLAQDLKDKISPINWATLEDIYKKERERQIFLSKHNWCFAEFSDEGIIGIAKSWGCMPNDKRPRCGKDFDPLDHKFDENNPCCIDDGAQLEHAILLRFGTAVTQHEVGHTLGLRHNFEGSSDLFNFHDKYYEIREKEPVPCNLDYECEVASGQYCNNGYCETTFAETCTTQNECGYVIGNTKCNKLADCELGTACVNGKCVWNTGEFDCVEGKCKSVKPCALHGDCGEDAYCDFENQWCIDKKTNKRIEKDVTNPDDKRVKMMIPRGELTENEKKKNRTIYQYSTIMDYGQRWNSDILDLGKYDYAAIRFGYGNLIDVYTNTAKLWSYTKQQAQYYGESVASQSDSLDTSYWSWGVFFSQLYFLQNYIGVEANLSQGENAKNRMAVPFDWVRDEHNVTSNYYRRYADWSFVQVPYKFCGDEYAGNVGCYTWDTGIDPLEIVHNMGIELKDYYLLDAFKRERYSFGLHGDPSSYLSRIVSRWMDPLKGAGMYYALFTHILKNYGAFRGIWSNGRLMGWPLRRASERGFEILANIIGSPAPGSFKYDETTKTYKNFSYFEGLKEADISVPLGIGKYPYTTFMNDAGYNFWDHAVWIGSFWEKLGALMTLTDSTVYFTTNYVGEQLNIGVGTSIGFNTLYPKELAELFGGVVLEDSRKYGHLVDQNKKVIYREWFDPANPDVYTTIMNGLPPAYYTPKSYGDEVKVVEPSLQNLTMKLYLMLYGMAYIPASFDPTFVDSFAICIKGSGDCYDINTTTGVEVTEFTNPFGGKTYVAWKPKYKEEWYSPNYLLVEKAKKQKIEWESVSGSLKAKAEQELRQTIETLDMMVAIYAIYSNIKI